MVRALDIQEKLLHLIGWEQNYDTSDLKISDALTASESGLYFQQIHPLLTLQNMSCIAPDFKNTTFEEYDAEKSYSKGNVVKYDNRLFKAIKLCKGVAPCRINLVKNASFEEFTDIEQQEVYSNGVHQTLISDVTTDSTQAKFFNLKSGYNSIQSSKVIVSGNSHSGKHAIRLTSSNTRLQTEKIKITRGGNYEISVYAKLADYGSIPGNQRNKMFKLGLSYCSNDGGSAVFTYSDYLYCTEEYRLYKFVVNVPEYEYYDTAFITGNIKVEKEATIYFDDLSIIALDELDRLESEYWAETNPFSEWLESKTKASIQKAIARYCNEKIAQGTYKALCENRTLFDGTGRLVDVVKNKKNLVGFEVVPVRAKGVTTKINKIGLQFTEPGEYTLYLMHSSMNVPIKVIKLNKIRKNSTEWFSLNDVYLPYQSEDNDAGGSWYLCYFQSELPEGSQAIRKDKDWSKEPCGSCSRKELLAWMAWSKYIEVHPFFVNEELVEIEEEPHLWDVENNQYTYDNNYGLNLEITISCDITDFIIEQRMLFQDVIAKQVAVDMLREFAYNANARTNRHSINASRLDILYEVDGDSSSMKKSGLSYQLDMAFKAIKLSTEGIDRVCLPCKNNGIKYRTI
jgi:hypothetical protein